MVFGLIALSFAPFPFYPPHASQAGPQKTLQICAFLVQVASLGDLNDVSNIRLMTSPCIRPHFGDILTSPTWFGSHFSLSDNLFSWCFWKCHPRLHRKHNSEYSHKAFLIKTITFSMSKKFGSESFSRLWRTRGPLDHSKSSGKTNAFSTFSLFGPTKPAHIPFTCAI